MKRAFYPLLLSLYPVLALLANNIDEAKPADALRAFLVLLGIGWGLFFLLRLVLRDAARAALLFSIAWMLFFSYGHVYLFLEQNPILGHNFGRHRLLIPVWALLLVAGVWWVASKRANAPRLTTALNTIAIVLMVFPLLQIATSVIRTQTAWSEATPASLDSAGLQVPAGQTPPDIYYIILDAYARNDVFQETFDYDNTPFLNQLEALGFYVADCSQTNYAQTELSMASSLNFNYLEALNDEITPEALDRSPLRPLIKRGAARQLLEALGYQTVSFETGYKWSQWDDADFFLVRADQVGGMNDFEAMLVASSAYLVLTDAASVLPKFLVPDVTYPKHNHRDRVLSTLDKLSRLPTEIDSPKLVFAHIVAPHIPFVFGPQGEEVLWPDSLNVADYQVAYRDEVIYLNQRILIFVQDIINNSATPPVIILQADHGRAMASPEIRMRILNAYYLPGSQNQVLTPQITPVNTFRVIFNKYFGGSYEYLEDHSYYSDYTTPFQYQEILNTCK